MLQICQTDRLGLGVRREFLHLHAPSSCTCARHLLRTHSHAYKLAHKERVRRDADKHWSRNKKNVFASIPPSLSLPSAVLLTSHHSLREPLKELLEKAIKSVCARRLKVTRQSDLMLLFYVLWMPQSTPNDGWFTRSWRLSKGMHICRPLLWRLIVWGCMWIYACVCWAHKHCVYDALHMQAQIQELCVCGVFVTFWSVSCNPMSAGMKAYCLPEHMYRSSLQSKESKCDSGH